MYNDPASLVKNDSIYTYLPSSWRPFAELIRLGKPAGAFYLYIPSLSATLLAATIHDPTLPRPSVLRTSFLFLVGSFVFRGAACTWNDILDQDIDRRVTRTLNRPLARGAISTISALIFTIVQALFGFWILLAFFPHECLYYAVPSIVLISLYPLGKRVTQYPQVILGLTWAYGFVIAFPAMGIDLAASPRAAKISASLYVSGIAWTILYDTVYAHQDIVDDKKQGVKSIAIQFERVSKPFLSTLGAVQIGAFAYAGYEARTSFWFFLACGFTGASLVYMIKRVNLKDPASCSWWFHRGICGLTGVSIVAACFGEYCVRRQALRQQHYY